MSGQPLQCPEPGLYPGVPFHDYIRWDAASNSQLSHLLRSPAHLRAYLDGPSPDKGARRLGRAFHFATLEPALFESGYVMKPVPDGEIHRTDKGEPSKNPAATGAYKQAVAALAAANPDALLLDPDQYGAATSMRDAVLAHPLAGPLARAPGQRELSVVWDDPATGVRCKARMDQYSPDLMGGTVADWKSTRDAGEPFERDFVKYGYHRQATMYLMAAAELSLTVANYVIPAVESEAPHGIIVYRISEQAIGDVRAPRDGQADFGVAAQIRALLRIYDRCRRTNEWPGYQTIVRDVSVPEWAWRSIDRTTARLSEEVAA